jgi:hypothetical protein
VASSAAGTRSSAEAVPIQPEKTRAEKSTVHVVAWWDDGAAIRFVVTRFTPSGLAVDTYSRRWPGDASDTSDALRSGYTETSRG